jgi:hypothetical protein
MDFKKTENLEFLKKVLSSGGNDGFLKIENLELKKKLNSGTLARKLFQI